MSDYIRKAIVEKDSNTEKQPGLSVHTGPIWGAQVSFIGTIHSKMQKVQTF